MEQITTCGDVMAQDYLMDCIVQVNIANTLSLTIHHLINKLM